MCAPARAALMTGKYPQRVGVFGNNPVTPGAEVLFPEILKELGYRTAVFGKWHLGVRPDQHPNSNGFDEFFGFHTCNDYYSHRFYWGDPARVNYHDLWRNRTEVFKDGRYFTELVNEEAIKFIHACHSTPFFMYLPYSAVHYPMHAPSPYVERFPDLEPERQMYAAMLSVVDDGLGAIIETLETYGLRDNTCIFFASDNGATRERRAGLNQQPAKGGSNAPFRGAKFSLFEGGIRVPAIVSWPDRVPARQVVSEVGSTMDLFPTIVRAAGGRVPDSAELDGRDILPMVTDGAASPHEELFWASQGQLAVRHGKWKLVKGGLAEDIVGGKPIERLKDPDSLFLADLAADPGESTNLRSRYPQVAQDLEQRASAWLQRVTAEGKELLREDAVR